MNIEKKKVTKLSHEAKLYWKVKLQNLTNFKFQLILQKINLMLTYYCILSALNSHNKISSII